MPIIKVQCPRCLKDGNITIQEGMLHDKKGITAINVAEKVICKHSFLVYVDRNYIMRDAFSADFNVILPELKLKQEEIDTPYPKSFDIYLLIINLRAITFVYILKSIFSHRKILIINDINNLKNHFNEFIKFITQGTFETEIVLESRDLYVKNRKKYNDYIIIDGIEILNDKDKLLNDKKIEVEQFIVKNFLAENNPETGLIILKNEIKKAFILSKEIIEFNNKLRNEKYSSKKILDHFMKTRNLKISYDYLNFLTQIIKDHFNLKLSTESTASDFFSF